MAKHGQSGFRVTLSIVGVVYALMASSMLVRGPEVLGEFGVSPSLRDLSTSDSTFGNRLYRGPKTLVFVGISLALALIFAALAVLSARGAARAPGKDPPSARDCRLNETTSADSLVGFL